MKSYPILFSTPMVRAIIDGKKTQTRRIIKFPSGWIPSDDSWDWVALQDFYPKFKCPYGDPGDQLWVRETYSIHGVTTKYYVYKTDPPSTFVIWKPSIHMPRSAARIFLEVTNIRIERLHDITEADAKAEGMIPWLDYDTLTAKEQYMELWDSINFSRAPWESNPWVWVVTFKTL